MGLRGDQTSCTLALHEAMTEPIGRQALARHQVTRPRYQHCCGGASDYWSDDKNAGIWLRGTVHVQRTEKHARVMVWSQDGVLILL